MASKQLTSATNTGEHRNLTSPLHQLLILYTETALWPLRSHSEQAVVAHACHGHGYRPSPVPLSGTKKKGGGGGSKGEDVLRCYEIWNVP